MSSAIHAALQGRVIAVTGATRGIGRALVETFAAYGAHVVAHGRKRDDLERVVTDVRRGGGAVAPVIGDLRESGLGARIVEGAISAYGHLDVLVLNAGMLGPMTPLAETPADAIDEVLAVSVGAQVHLYAAAARAMRARGAGVVIWMSSGLGRFGLEGFGIYCAAKHAVEGLMKVAALEDAEHGLVHVAVAPGMVQTDMLRAAMLGADVSAFETPQRTAEAFARMLCECDDTMNGKSIDIGPWMATD